MINPSTLCKWCGQTYADHLDSRPPGTLVPRVPCTGIKRYFFAEIDRDATTEPPPPASERTTLQEIKLTDSQKIDRALGLLELLGSQSLETHARLDRIEAKVDAVVQHVGGIRAAQIDLRERVEGLEQHIHSHANGSSPPAE